MFVCSGMVVGGEDGEEVLLLALGLGKVIRRGHQDLDSLEEEEEHHWARGV